MKPAKTRRSLQFIIPLSIIALLFCSGIYLGATRRETVLSFEKKYLDMDHFDDGGVHHPLEDLLEPAKATVLANPLLSSVPTANAATLPQMHVRALPAGQGVSPQLQPAPKTTPPRSSAPPVAPQNPFEPRHLGRQPAPAAVAARSPRAMESGNPASASPEQQPSLPSALPPPVETPVEENAERQPGLNAPPSPVEGSSPPQTGKIASASAQGKSTLRDLYELPVTIRIKVLADEDFVSHNDDWMAKIQTVVAEVSRIYRNHFGIEIQLVGLGQWPLTTTGRTARQLYGDLTARATEGADVLLGFVNRELEPRAYARSNAANSAANNRFSLVGRSSGSDHSPFLKGTLRSLGHLLGAREIEDVNSEEFQLGSWMSSKPLPSHHAPWIGAENRRRILKNKTRPFSAGPDRGEHL